LHKESTDPVPEAALLQSKAVFFLFIEEFVLASKMTVCYSIDGFRAGALATKHRAAYIQCGAIYRMRFMLERKWK
jgi:hypothetical protein